MLTAGVETVNIFSIVIQCHNISMPTTTVMLHIYRVIQIIEILIRELPATPSTNYH